MKKYQVLPQLFLDRINMIVSSDRYRAIVDAYSSTRPTTFRANTLKMSSDQVEQELQKEKIQYQKIGWYTNAFILLDVETQHVVSLRRLQETNMYKTGSIYVQSLSSMIPPLVLDPQRGERVLDLCAAPGSKTTQMAMMMGNSGEIVANEKSHVRMYKLKANIQMQGVTNTTVCMMPGQILWQKYPDYFDKVLVDVPCSMEGRISIHDPDSYADWSMKKIKSLVQIQRFLLKSAISATKPGGYIVYSTCTVAPEENEGVIDWVLKKYPHIVETQHIASLQIPDVPIMTGISGWNERIYHPDVSKTLRILPSETMEGFYVALLKKCEDTLM